MPRPAVGLPLRGPREGAARLRGAGAKRVLGGLWILLCGGVAFAQEGAIADYKRLSLSELMDLEVTSVSRQPEKLSGTASAIQVITGDDIRRSGASSLPEALRLATNLQVAQKGSQGWAVSARGFNTELSNKLLVMVDGRTVYSPLFSGVFWDAQDRVLADIERVEVVSGPGSALWGANAVNGVINIITKSAADTQGLHVETAVGTELENMTALRYGLRLAPSVHLRLYGKFLERDGGVFADGSAAPTDWQSRRGGFRLDAVPGPRNTFTLQGDIYDIDEDRPGGEPTDLGGGNLLGRWTHLFDDDSEMTLQFYYDRTNLSQYMSGLLVPDGRFNDRLETYDLDFQHRFEVAERHRIVWGLGYRRIHDVADNIAAFSLVPDRIDHELYSAFVQGEIRLGRGWSLTFGAKVEHNDYTGFEYEPNVRAQWAVAPTHVLWAAVSRAVRMPSRVDRDLRQPAAPVILAGDEGFESENVVAFELGYRGRPAPWLLASASVFYNRYDDIRSVNFTPVTLLPLYFDNQVEGETYGLELDSTWQAASFWRLRAGYTLLLQDLRVERGGFDLNNALNETADPRHQFSLRSSWDLPRRVELDAGLRWVDELRVNDGGVPAFVPSYWELDLRLAWRPRDGLEIALVGRNLLHDQHLEYGAPDPAREEVEREVYAKVTWSY